MKRHFKGAFFLLTVLAVLSVNSKLLAATVYIDDGASHTINDSTYQNDLLWLDYYTANTPGTHVELVDGGTVRMFLPFNNSSIMINGGIVDGSNVAIDTQGDNIVTINGGTMTGDIASNNNSRIFVNGGFIEDLFAYDTGIVEVSGGLIGGVFGVFDNGTIYLNGNDFSVDGIELSQGDKLRDYGTLSNQYYTGVITGTLSNGSALNNTFYIQGWGMGTSDIVIVPEPATLLLLGLGGLMLRKKRS